MESETPSPERQKWEKIFGTLVAMLQSQQHQLQSLLDERSLLQDRFKHQHINWVSDVQILESQSSRMKREVSLAEKSRELEIGKSQLLDSLNRSKSLIYNLKLEYAESDLVDLWTCFELLQHKLTEYELSQDKSKETGDNNSIADELLKLKHAYDNLESKHKSEISTLLAEKDFVWNQFRNMENECTTIRKSTQVELEQAKEKIQILMTNTELLQSSNTEKDEIIFKLKSDIAKLEAENENKSREISRLNSRGPLTPVLNSSTARARAALKSSFDRRSIKKEADSSSSQASEKDSRGSKRKEAGNIRIPTPIPIAETPKLFSSKFRVPKLKTDSPCTSASAT